MATAERIIVLPRLTFPWLPRGGIFTLDLAPDGRRPGFRHTGAFAIASSFSRKGAGAWEMFNALAVLVKHLYII